MAEDEVDLFELIHQIVASDDQYATNAPYIIEECIKGQE
jgi:hypothetical protein